MLGLALQITGGVYTADATATADQTESELSLSIPEAMCTMLREVVNDATANEHMN